MIWGDIKVPEWQYKEYAPLCKKCKNDCKQFAFARVFQCENYKSKWKKTNTQ